HLGDICTVLTFGGYLYVQRTFGGYLYILTFGGIYCTVLTFGGYLYRPDILGPRDIRLAVICKLYNFPT
ncbi:unnamed protein product, partial [Staurois parvus]